MLINGSPTFEFKLGRDLWHGNPLLSILFILDKEGLHIIIENALTNRIFYNAHVRIHKFQIYHFFYAYNILFVGEFSLSCLFFH